MSSNMCDHQSMNKVEPNFTQIQIKQLLCPDRSAVLHWTGFTVNTTSPTPIKQQPWPSRKDPHPRKHYTFTLGTNHIRHSSHCYNQVLKINSTGNFNSAVNILRANSHRTMYAIKRKCPLETLVWIWPDKLESAVLPIALYASGTRVQ